MSEPLRRLVRHALMPWSIALAGALGTLGVSTLLFLGADEAANGAMDRLAARIEREVERCLDQGAASLYGARLLLQADRPPSRSEFRGAARARSDEAGLNAVQGLGYAERVPRGTEADFLARERAHGVPDLEIREIAPHPGLERWVVKSAEPKAEHGIGAGLDLASDAALRAAIDGAVADGGPFAALPTHPSSTGAGRDLLIVVLPVFASDRVTATAAQRRAAVRGVVFAAISVSAALREALSVTEGRADVELSLHGVGGEVRVVADTGATDAAAPSRFVREAGAVFANQPLSMRVSSRPAFEAELRSRDWIWAASAGTLLTALLVALAHGSTSRHRAAERLARHMTAQLERLAMVARHTRNGVILSDVDGRIIWVNDAFERMTGHALPDARGHAPADLLFGGRSPAGDTLPIDEAIGRRTAYSGEMMLVTRDGEDRWVDAETVPVHDGDGRHTGFVLLLEDITERRRRDAALAAAQRESEALLRTIRTHAIVSVADVHGRIVDANEAFCAISGYGRGELLGQDHRILNSGHHDEAFWLGLWGEIAHGRPWRGRICNRAKDGRLYWVDSIIAPFVDVDGRVEKYVSVRHDVTDSVRAAEALARERERLALVLQATGAGIWDVDLKTGADSIDERYADMLGETVESLNRRRRGFIELVHPDDREQVVAARQAHMGSPNDQYTAEFRMQHADGRWVWVLSRGRVVARDADGQPRRMMGLHLDISERKRVEQELQASQALLDATGRIAHIGGWTYDIETRAVTWSDETCRIHDLPPGHRPTLDEAVGFYAPHARERVRQLVRLAIEGGQACDEVLPLVTAAGRAVSVRVMGHAECAGGRAVRLVGAIQDVTERRRIEEEVRRSQALLASVLENMPCGLSVFDGELKLISHNRRFRQLLDFPDRVFEAPAPSFESMIRFNAERGEYGHGDVEAIVEARVAPLRGGIRPHSFERVRPDGTVLEIQGTPLPGGGVITTYVDITERKRVEQAAQRSEALLRGAIDAVDEAFVLYDPDDRLVLCNEKYRRMYPTSADLIVPGARFEDIIRGGAERGQYAAAIGRVDDWVAERLALHRAGDTSMVQRLDDGRVVRVIEARMADGHTVGFRIDITDLTRATEAAEQAARTKGQFLANMSHEIRTPMNAVLGMLKLLRRTRLDPRQDDYAAKAEGAAQALLELINDVLDFSKAEAGRMELDPRPFDLRGTLNDLAIVLSASAGAKPLRLRIEADAALPRVLVGDPLRLSQVLTNLGSNAVKFTECGEVVVEAQVTRRAGASVMVAFSVRDTGIGIAEEHRARIFTGFSQAETSTTRRYGGTGLGLAISRHLVALMGGELALDSEVGRGSRFHFEIDLPLAEADAVPAPSRAPAAPSHGVPRLAGLHLLLAEDNPHNQQVARELLEAEGALVRIADDGLQAVQAVAVASPPLDAVLMDLQMPGLDGLAATSRIRQQLGQQALPIVAMTANVTAADRDACLAAGMNDHVGKPFDLDQLVAVLRRWTGRSGALPAAPVAIRPDRSLHAAVLQRAGDGEVRIESALARMGGRVDVYRKLLRNFVDDLPSLQAALDETADPAAVERLAHAIKGLAGTLGAEGLSAAAARAESALGGEDAQAAPEALRRALAATLGNALHQAAGPLRALLQVLDGASAAPAAAQPDARDRSLDKADLVGALVELDRLLADADMAALGVLDGLRERHAGWLGSRLGELDDAILRLEFDRAGQACKALLQDTQSWT